MAYRKEELAHRVAYMLEHKLLPEELQAMSGGLELLESHINNMSRLHCEKQGMCSANHRPLCLL